MTSDSTLPDVVAPIDCETTVRRLWDYLDGRLASIPREEVEAHLASCALCPPHFTFARDMQRALARDAAVRPADDDAEAQLRARVRDALRRCVTESTDQAPSSPDDNR